VAVKDLDNLQKKTRRILPTVFKNVIKKFKEFEAGREVGGGRREATTTGTKRREREGVRN